MLEPYHGYSVDPWGHVSKNITQSVRFCVFRNRLRETLNRWYKRRDR